MRNKYTTHRFALLIFVLVLPILLFGQNSLQVKTFTLKNGMTVWINEDHTQPKVFGAVVVRSGAKDCPNSGIAHYLEHLLFKGTKRIGTVDYKAEKPWLDSISDQYDLLSKTSNPKRRFLIQRHINELSIKAADYAIPNEFSNLISLYGGTRLNAYTSFDETVFHNFFSPPYLRQWCELNSERLKDPVFRLFQGELETVYEEKNMYSDNLLTSTAERAQEIALAGTPYAYPILGATDSLKNPSLSEMMRFFKEKYVPENMGLILSGDIKSDSIGNILENTFGTLGNFIPGRHKVQPLQMDKKAVLPDYRSFGTLRLKVPIPIVKIGGFAWQAPNEKDKDYAAFKVMTSMLTNNDKTGLIDSLYTSGKLLFTTGMGYDFKDFSAWGFGFVPNLPFGSRKKAERICFEQIDKLKHGDFTDAMLDAEKLTLSRNRAIALETINGRRTAMINAFSHGLPWDDVINESKQIAAVTKDDIMRVAKMYLNDDSLKIVKKFGHYPKEHISQPGYKPVKPKNAGARSEYAKEMAKEPVGNASPKFVQLQDAKLTELSPLVKLYTVRNPINDIFTLQIIYRRGYRNDKRLSIVADYINKVGTGTHNKHQFGMLLRQNGATIKMISTASNVTLTLTGFDSRFKESMALLHEIINEPEVDNKKFKDEIKSLKLEQTTFFKENQNIAQAVFQKVTKGENSDFINRMSAKELRRMNADELVNVFKELQSWQTDIVYCGTQDAKDIENIVKSCINVNKVKYAWQPVKQELKNVNENIVYLYNNPSARQTIVGAYQQFSPMPSIRERSQLSLWGNYFGGGMQSVIFQEIREFRSLAYSAHGSVISPDLKIQASSPCGYITMVGTQADKAMQTTILIDSLLNNMPVNEANIKPARQSIINSINNSYPSFRSLGSYIAQLRLYGYDHDPNSDYYDAVRDMDIKNVTDYFKRNVQGRPKILFIVGNKKALNLQELAKLGKVIELSKDDIYNH